jgi:hypothetical protein
MTPLLVAALGLTVAAPDAGARAADRDGEAAVAAAFKAYQAALLAKNGPRAAATLARRPSPTTSGCAIWRCRARPPTSRS